MKFFFSVIFFLAFLTSFAQELPVPQISKIEVDTVSNLVKLEFKVDDISLIDGYIIKRKIVDGQGVVKNSYQTIATIENNLTTSFIDNTKEYSTTAKPLERVEYYRICSYKIVDNKQKLSLMSDEVSTMICKAEYNDCIDKYTVNWTPLKGIDVDYYIVHSNHGIYFRNKISMEKDTFFTYHFKDFYVDRCFVIEAVSNNGSSCFSTVATTLENKITPPDELEITNITTIENGFDFLVSFKTNLFTKNFYLCYQNDSLLVESDNFQVYSKTDSRLDFTMVANNICDMPFKFSPTKSNVFLEVKDEGNQTFLSWNNFDFNQEFKSIVYCKTENDFEPIEELSSSYNQFTHYLNNDISHGQEEGRYCYYVENQSINGLVAKSNTVCINKESVIFIPNAINPNSSNMEDWIFHPKASYLKNYSLKIFDKRGVKLFESNDLQNGWDGRNASGKLYEMDTYFYYIEFTDSSNKKQVRKGVVNLVY